MEISYWEKDILLPSEVDICIVGAGLTGLWSAYEYAKKYPENTVLIIEKGIIPQGASTRNAGFACFGSPSEILYDISINGVEKTMQVVKERFCGIQKIKHLFPKYLIDYEDCGGYDCLEIGEKIVEQLPFLNNLLAPITGSPNTFYTVAAPKELQSFPCVVKNDFEASIHSGKLVKALTELVKQMSVQILYGTAFEKSENLKNDKLVVKSSNGFSFITSHILFTTNAFTQGLFPKLNVLPGRGLMLLSAPIDNFTLNGTFHAEEGFIYFRNIGKRLLIGGARNKNIIAETTTEFGVNTLIKDALLAFTKKHFTQIKDIIFESEWSGIMAFTPTKLAEIVQINPKQQAIICCNGMGVALSPIIAEHWVSTMQ